MLQRYAVKLPRQSFSLRISTNLRQQPHPLPPSPLIRFTSSSTEKSRRLHGSDSRSKSLFLRFAIGGCIGLVGYGSWSWYEYNNVQSSFTTYTLVAKEPVSSTASIFHLEPKVASQDLEKYQKVWKKGIWNVHFKQPQIQIVRAYTPLPSVVAKNEKDTQDLRFLIRHDPHGEVSSYLHRLPPGSDIELRGPNLEYELTPDIQQVVFFAGGTGIAPALQIAHAMFDNTQEQKSNQPEPLNARKLHILWASRKREDCLGGISDHPTTEPIPAKSSWSGLISKTKPKPKSSVFSGEEQGVIVQELEALKKKHPGQITVEYFVNAEGTWIDEDVVFRTLSRFDDKDFSKGHTTSQEQRQILISGPDGFISYLAGPKEWKNGRQEQGYVSNILAHAIAQNPHHVKVWKI